MKDNNIWQTIVCDEVIETMRLLGCDKRHTDGNASDFERFREWLAAYPYMRGNTAAKNAAIKISEYVGIVLTEEELCRIDARTLWRAHSDRNSVLSFCDEKSYYDFCFSSVIKCDEKDKILSNAPDLNRALENAKNDGKTDFDEFIKYLKKSTNNCFGMSVTPCEFIRPDRYHAHEYYSKYIHDEKSNQELIMTQAVCELIFDKKCEILQLHFAEKDSIYWIRSFIKYLSMRKLSICILLFVNEKNTPEEIRELCLSYEDIIPVLTCSDPIYLQSFAKDFPIGAVIKC